MNAASVIKYITSRAWAMEAARLMELAHAAAAALENASPESIDAAQAKTAARTSAKRDGYEIRDGVAHIQIAGPMLKDVPCIFDLMGLQATSTVATKQALEAAFADDAVDSISLDIDSPGGSLAGIQELADAVYATRGQKPIVAHISDLSASAAYWVASQADKVTANESALIGSIGVYSVMEDSSDAAAKAGVRVHVLRSHELKGAGIDGSQVTAAQLTDEQRIVDGAADMFIDAVARGRGLSRDTVKEMATGQVWFGQQAKDKGLIDAIASAGSAHASVVTAPKSAPRIGAQERIMSTESTTDLAVELAAEKAKSAALTAQFEALQAQRRDDLITKYRDRIAPAALASVEEYGKFCGADATKFEAFLKAMPPVTRADRGSQAPRIDDVNGQTEGIVGLVGREPSGIPNGGEAGARQISKWLGGMSIRKMNAFAGVKGMWADGTFELQDGRNVTKEELKELIAKAG